MKLKSLCLLVTGVFLFGGPSAAALEGQDAGHPYQQVVSANPFGLLLEFFNAEYERGVSESATAGIGGSYGSYELDSEAGTDFNYFNLDGFWRFYPSGSLFEGWNFGVKVGVTSMDDRTYPGFGFDANRSWLLGKNDNFYVGLGFGLKRLIGDIPEDEFGEPEGPRIIPTFRIVNVGFAF